MRACLMRNLGLPLIAVILAACSNDVTTQSPIEPSPLHQSLLTLDTHVDIPLDYMKEVDPQWETELQVDLPKMKAGGLDAAFFIVYTPQTPVSEDGYKEALEIAETRYRAIQEMTDDYSDRIELALRADDVRRIVGQGKLAALIGMENAYPLGGSIKNVPLWARRGVRYMGITHMGHNQFGDSSNLKDWDTEDTPNGGLTPLGKQLIRAMNNNGIMVDVSHAGKQTMMQATRISRAPVIASHSGVKSVLDNARNLDDMQLVALKENGGVVQLVALGAYVKAQSAAQKQAMTDLHAKYNLASSAEVDTLNETQQAEYTAERKTIAAMDGATVSDYVDHIDHAVRVAGIDHVGIASDFDGGGGIIGWKDATETPNVTAELVKRGYSEEDIAKIWGGNLLRVMEAVEQASNR